LAASTSIGAGPVGATVQIRQHGHIIRTGTVDDAMADSTALWIAGDAAQPRTMYEAAHGIEVWTEPEETGDGLLLDDTTNTHTHTQLSQYGDP
jgi:hypothetical protein